MDGEADTRSTSTHHNTRFKNICKKRQRRGNYGRNDKRIKQIRRKPNAMVHPKFEDQTTTGTSNGKKSNGRVWCSEDNGYARELSNESPDRLRMYGIVHKQRICKKNIK